MNYMRSYEKLIVKGVKFKSGREKIWSYSLTKKLVENVKIVMELWVIGLKNIYSINMT